MYGNPTVVDAIIPFLKAKNEYIRTCAAQALGRIKDRRAVEPLIKGLDDPSAEVKRFTAEALGLIGDQRALPALLAGFENIEHYAGTNALFLLGNEDTVKGLREIAETSETRSTQDRAKGLAQRIEERLAGK